MTEEEQTLLIANVTAAGGLGYTLNQIKYSFTIPEWNEFKKEFETPGSPLAEAYKQGQLSAQFEMEKTLLDRAKLGDKDSIELLWRIKTKRDAQLERDPTYEVGWNIFLYLNP